MKSLIKESFKKLIISTIILIVGAGIGYVSLVFVFKTIHISPDTFDTTFAIIHSEGFHPRDTLRNGVTDYYHEPFPDILDFGTDELIVQYSLLNPTQNVLSYSLIPEYFRYWHGYITIFRPLFKFFDLSEIRVINLYAQMMLSIILAFLIYTTTRKKRYMFAWVSIYCMILPTAISMNFQYSSIYYVTVISSIFLLLFNSFWIKNKNFLYLFLITGMLTVYFDFLTYPILAWAIPAVMLVLIIRYENDKHLIIKSLIDLFLSAFAWCAGYFLFWVEKWALSAIMLKEFSFDNIYNQIIVRSGVDKLNIFDRFEGIETNWKHYAFWPFILIMVGWLVFLFVDIARKGMKLNYKVIPFSLIMLSPICWYLIVSQHTASHALFAWRNSLGFFFALWIMLCVITDVNEEGIIVIEKKKGWLLIPSIAVLILLSFIAYYFIPTERTATFNYVLSKKATNVVLEENKSDAFSMEFVPQNRTVTKISPIIESDNRDIKPILILSSNGKILHKRKMSFKNETNIIHTHVYWRLKPGEIYTLTISTEGVSEPISVWLCKDEESKEYITNEYSILNGVEYNVPFTSKVNCVLFFLSYFTVFLVVLLVLSYYIFGAKKGLANE